MAGAAECEWDPAKATLNVENHGVSFEEAATVFADIYALTEYDERHSDAEDREVTIGVAESRRLLAVVHTMRGERIRIISARLADRRERQQYEQNLVRYLQR